MNISNKALLLVSISLSLLILEIGIRSFTIYPINYKSSRILDNRLEYKVDPKLKDIDEHGFRNYASTEPIEIVAIGDSHTFGNNVQSQDSWPQQLASMLNKRVYNFGMGGYGILQYKALFDDAMLLKPKYLVLGLYLMNDLHTACQMIAKLPYWQNWAVQNNINTSICPKYEDEQATRSFPSLNVTNIAIISAFKFLVKLPMEFEITSLLKKLGFEKDILIINDDKNKTLIDFGIIVKRKNYLNKPEVKFGLEIAKIILQDAKVMLDKKNIKFGVVFLPSKQRAYYDYLLGKHFTLPDVYHEMVRNELMLTEKLANTMTKAGIPFIDAKPYVEQTLYDRENVYPSHTDGHPLEPGYRAYALAAANMIKSD